MSRSWTKKEMLLHFIELYLRVEVAGCSISKPPMKLAINIADAHRTNGSIPKQIGISKLKNEGSPSRWLRHRHASCPNNLVATTVGWRDIAVVETGVSDRSATRRMIHLLGRVGRDRGVT